MTAGLQAFVERLAAEPQAWTLRPAGEADEERMAGFLGEIFGEFLATQTDRSMGPGYLRWLLRDNPGRESSAWIAEVEGRIVGLACWVPARIQRAFDRQPAFQLGAVAVGETWRNQGLFLNLLYTSARRFAAEPAMAGFSVGQRPVLTKALERFFGWRVSLEMSELVLPLRPGALPDAALPRGLRSGAATALVTAGTRALARAASRLGRLATRGFDVRRVTAIDDAVGAFAEEASRSYDWVPTRDRRYLQWRYLDHPLLEQEFYVISARGAVRGYTVLHRHRGRQGVIVDLFVRAGDRRAYAAGLAFAVGRLQDAGVDAIRMKQHPAYWAADVARMFLPFRRPNTVALVTAGGEAARDDGRRWHVSAGDLL